MGDVLGSRGRGRLSLGDKKPSLVSLDRVLILLVMGGVLTASIVAQLFAASQVFGAVLGVAFNSLTVFILAGILFRMEEQNRLSQEIRSELQRRNELEKVIAR